jgi:hypothetical protein
MVEEYNGLLLIGFMVFYVLFMSHISELEDIKHLSAIEQKKRDDPKSYEDESKELYLSFKKNKYKTIKNYWLGNSISLYCAEQMVQARVEPFMQAKHQ